MEIKRLDPGKRMSEAVVHNHVAYLAGQIPEDTSKGPAERHGLSVEHWQLCGHERGLGRLGVTRQPAGPGHGGGAPGLAGHSGGNRGDGGSGLNVAVWWRQTRARAPCGEGSSLTAPENRLPVWGLLDRRPPAALADVHIRAVFMGRRPPLKRVSQ